MPDCERLIAEAKACLARRDETGARALMEKAYPLAEDPVQKAGIAGYLGGFHAARGMLSEAEHWFGQATELAPDQPSLWFELGHAREALGELEGALRPYLQSLHSGSRNARHYLSAGNALHQLDRTDEAVEVWSLGDGLDPMLRKAQFHPRADELTRRKSRRADRAICGYLSELHRDTVAAVGGVSDAERIAEAIWVQTHDEPFHFSDPLHQPQFFYVPELPAVPVFPRDELHWSQALEAKAGEIHEEYLRAVENGQTGEPYVHGNSRMGPAWDALKGKDRWKSIHLYKDGKPQEALRAFPKTDEALRSVPLVRVDGRPLEVFFSVLKAGAHIPPHFGLANSRMTVHLPLAVPDECAIKVAEETRRWRPGRLLAFDDSFRHEAWNGSDHTRVVLIFEAWAPDLTEAERVATARSFEARTGWLNARKVPVS